MDQGDSIQTILAGAPLSPRAALEATVMVCVALQSYTPSANGRVLSTASVVLFPDGRIRLQNIGPVDALVMANLLAHMLTGSAPEALDTDLLLHRVEEALQLPSDQITWQRKLLALLKACRNPTPRSRPSLQRLQRRCEELIIAAPGIPLASVLSLRIQASTNWMDLPDASVPNHHLGQLLQSNDDDDPPVAAKPRKVRLPGQPPPPPPTPANLPEMPTLDRNQTRTDLWHAVTLIMALGLLIVSGLAIYQIYGPSSTPAAPRSTPAPDRGSRVIDAYQEQLESGFTVYFGSEPSGAIVSINGQAIGQTPTQAGGLKQGVHNIKITLGSDSFQQTIMIDRDARCSWTPNSADPWQCRSVLFEDDVQ